MVQVSHPAARVCTGIRQDVHHATNRQVIPSAGGPSVARGDVTLRARLELDELEHPAPRVRHQDTTGDRQTEIAPHVLP